MPAFLFRADEDRSIKRFVQDKYVDRIWARAGSLLKPGVGSSEQVHS